MNEFENFAQKHCGISSLNMHNYKNYAKTNPFAMTPNIIEERQMNVVAMDVFSRLMMDRIIFLGMPINDIVANVVNAQLLFLESVDNEKDISIYINSPGGAVYDGLGVYDLMQYVSPDIITVNMGMAASMAAVLLCAGTKEKRSALKHSRTMIHQPMGGVSGQASDMEITVKEINKLKKELYEIISFHSGKDYKTIEKDADRDCWLNSEETKKYGLVDNVLSRR
ncbi:MAG: ATP-dependent Clp protease proteolytic subunit [Candidatus Izemoplasmatales bacterium]